MAFTSVACSDQSSESLSAWQEPLNAFIREQQTDKAIPALSIAVVDDQRLVWEQGYGFADADEQRPATSETVYRVASISKLFTALAVMQLVEQGALDLDVPVSTYLPSFQPQNPFDKDITLRQLMSHRSGLVREPPVGHYFDSTAPTLEATVTSLNNTSLIYPPETKTKYSNAAVSVAGQVIEKTQEVPFADYMQRMVFEPLGLESTSFHPRPDLRNRLATGTMWTYDGRTFEAPIFELGMMPAANLYSTVSDLGRFMSALFAAQAGEGSNLISAESLVEMSRVQFAAPQEMEGFGLGFYVSTFEGEARLQHSGVMYGYATRVYMLPESKLGVAIVATVDASNPVVDRIGAYALSLLLAHKQGESLPSFQLTQPIDPSRARSLAGRYKGPRVLNLIVRDSLLILDNGSERYRLRTLGDTLITDDRLGYGYRLRTHGDTLVAEDGRYVRTEPTPPQSLNPAWQGLIGEYGWDHNTLYILEREGRLYALIEWFFYYPLTQVTADVYRLPDDGLYMGETLTFTRDAQEQATEANLVGVVFPRRAVAPYEGNIFRIESQRPVDTLRQEALAAEPPVQPESLLTPDLVDISSLDSSIRLDVRYASDRNFMGVPFYREPRAFLQRPAAEALVRVQHSLHEQGLGLVVYDGYRPWYVTKMFWDATPDSLKIFVADPSRGSRHNRGCAVDLGLVDLATGRLIEMPSGYDEFTPRAFADYPGGTARSRYFRELLRDAMESNGFKVYDAEWWHYDYQDWQAYPVMNVLFDEIGQ